MSNLVSARAKEDILRIFEWITNVTFNSKTAKGRPKKSTDYFSKECCILAIIGDTGSGKTFFLNTFLNKYNNYLTYEIQEEFNKKAIEEKLQMTSQFQNILFPNKHNILVIEDLDSIFETEQIAFIDIIKIVRKYKIPLLCTINSTYVNKIQDNKRSVICYNLPTPTPHEFENVFNFKYESSDIRAMLIEKEYRSNSRDIFSTDNEKAIKELKKGKVIGYNPLNINIIIHENYPYFDNSVIKTLANSDILDTNDKTRIEIFDIITNRKLSSKIPDCKMRPASFWTKTSNIQHKKKQMKNDIINDGLNSSFDVFTTRSIEEVFNLKKNNQFTS